MSVLDDLLLLLINDFDGSVLPTTDCPVGRDTPGLESGTPGDPVLFVPLPGLEILVLKKEHVGLAGQRQKGACVCSHLHGGRSHAAPIHSRLHRDGGVRIVTQEDRNQACCMTGKLSLGGNHRSYFFFGRFQNFQICIFSSHPSSS